MRLTNCCTLASSVSWFMLNGKCLEYSDLRIRVHDVYHFDEGISRYNTVRIKDDHVIVIPAPSPVSAILPFFLFGVDSTAAVKNVIESFRHFAQLQPLYFFFNPFVRIVAVAQNEDIKLRPLAGFQ